MADPLFKSSSNKVSNLIADPTVSIDFQEVIYLEGEVILEGDLVGTIDKLAPATGTAGGGNTGNGTVTLVAMKALTRFGTYTIELTAATEFDVRDPDGNLLAHGAALGAYVSPQINFTITAGGTPFIAGDLFTIAITAGSGKAVKSLPTAVDGSEEVKAIAWKDVDATEGDKVSIAAFKGSFNSNALDFTDHTLNAALKDKLRQRGILLHDSIKAY